jgi:hypothetical protein
VPSKAILGTKTCRWPRRRCPSPIGWEFGTGGQSDGTTLLDAQPSGNGYAATFSIALQTA